MSFTRWLRNLRSVIAPAGLQQLRRFGPEHRKPAARYRPQIEVLEDRLTPSTLTVTTPLDAVDLNDGLFSLREAIGAASSGDQITFDQSLSGSTINLDPTRGELLINKNLDILGPGANNLSVSGQNLSRVFEISAGATATISGLTIENGKAAYGGGIINDGTLTLSDSIVSGNFVTYIGGGIYNSGSATISGTTLSGNKSAGVFSSGGGGGGITNDGDLTLIGSVLSDNSAYDGGGIQNYATMKITGTTFSGNHGRRGGAIYNRYDTLTISDSALSDNSAVFGGAIYNESTLTVSGSTLSRNSASSSGGGIYNVATMTVSGSMLSGNSASSSGGGIYNDGKLTVDSSSTLSGNSSVSGGGIYNFFRGTVKVSASTLSRNSATNNGGGVYNFDRGSVSLSNSTLTGNSATHGGGIYNPYGALTLTNSTLSGNFANTGGGAIYNGFVDGAFVGYTATLTVRSSIVAGNSGNSLSPDLYQRSGLPTPTLTNSLIGDNTGSALVEAPLGAPDANGNLIGGPINGVINAMLDPLAYNGGPTQTMALRAGSPALDRGDNPGNLLANDQRGQPFVRTAGSQTDMGAFELQLVLLTPTVNVSSAGGTFNGSPFPAVATVAGVGGPFTASLEGVTPTLTYYAGANALAGAPTNAGTYTVVAAYAGSAEYTSASASTTFTIAQVTPAFSALTSATIVVGTSSATLGGKVSLGALVPTGSVAITVGAVTVSAAIHADGTFSASVPTGILPAGSYTITYSYGGDTNFKPASATQALVVLSAQQQIALIVNQVNALVTAGVLDSGNGNALIVKLNNAIASLNSGNTTAGVNQLNAVINQVNAFVKSGKLTSTDAQALFSAIDKAIAGALASPL